jgi:sugar phosphate isomerase/epimerase
VIPRNKVYLCDLGDDGETLALARRRGLNVEVQAFAFPGSGGLGSEVENYCRLLADFPGKVTMHGAYYDLNPLSVDPKLAELSHERYRQSIALAKKLKAHAVVFHSTFSPLIKSAGYLEGWIKQNADFWPDYARQAETAGQTLLFENLYEERPEILVKLMERIGSKSMKVCLDVGHVNLYSRVPVTAWVDALGPHLAALHVNDNNGQTDEHMPPGEGTVDYAGLFARLHAMKDPPMLALEVEIDDHFERSLAFLAKNGVDVGNGRA